MSITTRTRTVKDLDFTAIDNDWHVMQASPTMLERAANLLDDAVVALDEYGWLRCDYGSKERGFCAIGGMCHAQTQCKGRGKQAAFAVAESALGAASDHGVITFNDHYAKNKRVVRAWMHNTAKRLRKLAAQRS
jgi:hypothetical protein